MRVIIAGTRKISDDVLVKKAIEASGFVVTEIVSGGAQGVDESGERIARKLRIPVKQFPADWEKYGRRAGPLRNLQMAEYADALVAVWDGKSPGTRHMIESMRSFGKPVYVENL